MNRDNRQALDLDSLDLVTGGVAGSQAPTPKLNVNMHDLLDPFYGTNHAGAMSAFTLEIPLMGPGAMSGMPEVPTMPVAEAAAAPVGVKVCGNTNHASPTTAEVDTLSDAEQAKAEMDAAHAQGLSQAEAALAALEAEAGGCGGDEEPAVQAQADDGDGDGGGCGAGDGSGGGDGGGDGGGCGDDEDEDEDDDDDAMYADEGDDAVAYDEEVPADEVPADEPPVMQCGDGSPNSVGEEPADELAYPASVPNAVWVGTGEVDDGNVMHTQVEDSIVAPQVIGEYAETASVPDAQWVGYEGDDAQVALEGQAASVPDAQWVGYEGQEDVSASVPDAVWADSSAEQEDEPSSDDDWDLSQAGDELDQALEDHGVNLPIDFGNLGATVEGLGNDKSVGISKEDIVAGINSAIRG